MPLFRSHSKSPPPDTWDSRLCAYVEAVQKQQFAEAQQHFDSLWDALLTSHALAVIKRNFWKPSEREEREDCLIETRLQVNIGVLNHAASLQPLVNICAYTKTAARQVCIDHLRKQQPQFRPLRNKILLILVAENFATGMSQGKEWAGLAPCTAETLCLPRAEEFRCRNYSAFQDHLGQQHLSAQVLRDTERLSFLIRKILEWLGGAVSVDELTRHVLQLTGAERHQPESLQARQETLDGRKEGKQNDDILNRLYAQDLLQAFRTFLFSDSTLSRCQKGAVTLCLEESVLESGLQIGKHALACLLDFHHSEEQFHKYLDEVWERLPLEPDREIANALSLTDLQGKPDAAKVAACRYEVRNHKWVKWCRRNQIDWFEHC